MHRPISISFSLIVLSLAGSLRAQTPDATLDHALEAHVAVIARADGDSIVVRWAPSNAAVWLAGNESGYMLERAVVTGGRAGAFERVSAGGFRPWTISHWQEHLDARRTLPDSVTDYEGIASSLLYDSVSSSVGISKGFGDAHELSERKSSLEMSVGFALIAADRSAGAAEGLGLRYVDHHVKRGATYAYRVYLVKQPRVYRVDSATVTVENVRHDFTKSQTRIFADEGDHTISISWQANPKLGSYFVERSQDGGKTFARLTKVPMMTLRHAPIASGDSESYLDSGVVNYRPFVYRVLGTTSFADEEVVGEVKAIGRDRTAPGMPILFNPKPVPIHRAELTWQMNEPVAGDLVGFRILRGVSDSGLFKPLSANLLSPRSRSYSDSTYADTVANYYVVVAVDTARNESRSFAAYLPLPDTTPPMEPMWLSGRMDTNGVVTLKLKPNRERDLMGYRILRANSPEHEFSAIVESYADPDAPRARDTTYMDTVALRSLTPYVYYRAIALDRSYNESALSEILAVRRPDIIPPVPPVITGVDVTDTSVTLNFVPSSSEDVKSHTVLRRADPKGKWDTIVAVGGAARLAFDRKVVQNTLYEYGMVATDSSGLQSRLSATVTARPYRIEGLPAVTNLKLDYDSAKKSVRLTWEYSGPKDGVRFVVYRGANGRGVEQFASLKDPALRMMVDSNGMKSGSYEYAVRVVAASGLESPLSLRAKIVIR